MRIDYSDNLPYVAIGMDLAGGEWSAVTSIERTTARELVDPIDPVGSDDQDAEEWLPPDPPKRRPAMAKLGRGVLRLRLYWGWSQLDLEIASGVDQTTISRLERGMQRGLSIRRLAAILDALRVGDVLFEAPPTLRQTDLEVMLYGDPWKRADAEAERRLGW